MIFKPMLNVERVLVDLQSFYEILAPLFPRYVKLFCPHFVFIEDYSFLIVGNKDSSCSYQAENFLSEECWWQFAGWSSYLVHISLSLSPNSFSQALPLNIIDQVANDLRCLARLAMICIAWINLVFIFSTLCCFSTQEKSLQGAQTSRSKEPENLEWLYMALSSVKWASATSIRTFSSLDLLTTKLR